MVVTAGGWNARTSAGFYNSRLHVPRRADCPAAGMPLLPIEQLLMTAMDCHHGGDTQHALEIYQQVLVRDPENACALHFLGLIEHRAGRSAAAVELLRRCLRSAPQA